MYLVGKLKTLWVVGGDWHELLSVPGCSLEGMELYHPEFIS